MAWAVIGRMNHFDSHPPPLNLAQSRAPHDSPALTALYEACDALQRELPLATSPRITRGDLGHPLEDSLRAAIDQLYAQAQSGGVRGLPAAIAHHLGYWLALAGRYAEAWPLFRVVAEQLPPGEPARLAAIHNWRLLALAAHDWDAALAALELLAAAAPLETPFPVERFTPQRVLGTGGFAELYLCRELASDERVVVKAYNLSSTQQWPRAIFHEVSLLALVNHPGVPEVRQHGYVDPAHEHGPYCVLDFFDGLNLGAYVQQYGPLSSSNLRQVLRSVLAALAAVHEAGLLHCDIKPSNILLRLDGHGWHTQLIDFGIGVRLDDQAVGADPDERRPGTIGFAAPEQLGHLFFSPLTPAADVHALGQTALFALTGLGPSAAAERAQHLSTADPLTSLMLTCIANDPHQRPSVAQLQHQILHWEG